MIDIMSIKKNLKRNICNSLISPTATNKSKYQTIFDEYHMPSYATISIMIKWYRGTYSLQWVFSLNEIKQICDARLHPSQDYNS